MALFAFHLFVLAHKPEADILVFMSECWFLPFIFNRMTTVTSLVLELPLVHIKMTVITLFVFDWLESPNKTLNLFSISNNNRLFLGMAKFAGCFFMFTLQRKAADPGVIVIEFCLLPALSCMTGTAGLLLEVFFMDRFVA